MNRGHSSLDASIKVLRTFVTALGTAEVAWGCFAESLSDEDPQGAPPMYTCETQDTNDSCCDLTPCASDRMARKQMHVGECKGASSKEACNIWPVHKARNAAGQRL